MRKGQYEKAEQYQTYEELLFSDYQMVSMVLYGIYTLAIQEKNWERLMHW